MKKTYFLFLALFAAITLQAQTGTSLPYSTTFNNSAALTDWHGDTNTDWHWDSVQQELYIDDNTVTGVYENLYTPWFNTSTVANPVLKFMLKITDVTPSSCVPEVDLEYDLNGGVLNVMRHISTGSVCSTNDYTVLNGQWADISTTLASNAYIRYVFRADFVGEGNVEIKNVRLGSATTLGIDEMQSVSFSLYPNPAANQLYIQTRDQPIAEIRIYTSLGNLVYQSTQLQNGTLDVTNFAPGAYVAEVKTKDGVAQKKWMKL